MEMEIARESRGMRTRCSDVQVSIWIRLDEKCARGRRRNVDVKNVGTWSTNIRQ